MAGADAGADSELAGLVADASAERGEKVFRQCAACHKVQDGVNAVGPHLWDVVGREIAAVESYSYSDALASKEGAWDLAALYAYLEAPMEWAPGTKMVYPGLKDPQDRVDVITYLNEADGSPIEFDVAAAPAAEDATAETGDAPAGEQAAAETGDAPADEKAAAEEAEAAPEEDAEAGQTAEAETGQAPEGDAAETGMAEAEAPAAEEQAADAASAEDGGEAPAADGTEMAAAEAEAEAPSAGDAAAEPAAGQTAGGAGGELAALVENASAERGEATFRQCSVCHKVEDGANAVGPHLWGVVGREIASVDSFAYSDALKSKEGVWDLETLFAYLEAPMEWAPGTKMVYPGLKDPQDRVDVIAYLNEADGSPVEFQVAAAPAPPEDAEAAAGTATEDAAAEETAAEQAATEEMATEEAATADTATEEMAAEDTATEDTAAAETSTEAEAPAEDGTQMAAVAPEATDTGAASEGKYTELLAAADPAAGEAAFRQCRACHQVREGVHGVGPSLHGVVGRPIGAIDDYRYSNALKGLEGEWTLEKLMAYLENPRDWAPGTKMIYSGLEDAQTRANLIAWLNEQSDDPVSLD
jgi:cytochrome c2